MNVDPFSDILQLTRARAVLTGGFEAGGPWAIRFPARGKIKFSAVLKGGCWIALEGEPEPGRLEAGDVGLLAAQRSYVLASDLAVEPIDAISLFSGAGRTTARLGDGGDFAFIGGHVLVDPASGGLLEDVLPPWIHIGSAAPEAPVLRWLLGQIAEEGVAGLPGATLASSQLTQLLFIHMLRAHLKDEALIPAGWLRALADGRVAPALRAMHGDPASAWRLEDLAKLCAMSRTTFAAYFRKVVGAAPLGYLTQWRMRLARHALREGTDSVAMIAETLGYGSESAFSNAFKREAGCSPRAYRGRPHDPVA